jgi:hypothetical protein
MMEDQPTGLIYIFPKQYITKAGMHILIFTSEHATVDEFFTLKLNADTARKS